MGSSRDGCGQIRRSQARPGKRWQESTISVAQWLPDSACGKNMGLLQRRTPSGDTGTPHSCQSAAFRASSCYRNRGFLPKTHLQLLAATETRFSCLARPSTHSRLDSLAPNLLAARSIRGKSRPEDAGDRQILQVILPGTHRGLTRASPEPCTYLTETLHANNPCSQAIFCSFYLL